MKLFAVWLVITLLISGLFSGGYHYYLNGHPRRVLVIVDASFPMQAAWGRVEAWLKQVNARRYTTYSLATEKGRIHGWAPRLNIGKVAPYAPRDFTRLRKTDHLPEAREAGEVFFLTNAPPSETTQLGSWKIVALRE